MVRWMVQGSCIYQRKAGKFASTSCKKALQGLAHRNRSDVFSGLQQGPAERGHVKKRQKSSKSVKKFFDTFRQFSRRTKNVENRQKASKSFSTLFDNFRAAPFFRPLLGGSDFCDLRLRCASRTPEIASHFSIAARGAEQEGRNPVQGSRGFGAP